MRPLRLPISTTLPARFEDLLEADPFAPAVILVRPRRRDRLWARAAVEHHAIRIAGLCATLGLGPRDDVAICAGGALDVMATAWFVLASGRALTTADDALLLDDDRLAHARTISDDYALYSFAKPGDVALRLRDRTLTHATLLDALDGDDPVPPEVSPLLWAGLRALCTGEPLRVLADAAGDARAAVSAA